MRLINTTTLELKEFFDSSVPHYAILSHTWEAEEVSLQEMDQQHPSLKAKTGYQKIENACRLARTDRLDWVWVDTCCIDKKSSAELTEAINSMFQWYRRSKVCYAYLSDWSSVKPDQPTNHETNFAHCRWWTRGWTLQELIAPASVVFYDGEWTKRGAKSTDSLRKLIQSIAGIPEEALNANSDIRVMFSVSQKMSWAATRQTTRIEDMAYCLLGLFDINMPLLYGEGPKAFFRLQEQICQKTMDLTIFAWESRRHSNKWYPTLFASSLADFDLSIQQDNVDSLNPLRAGVLYPDLIYSAISEYRLTNNGLRVDGSLARVSNNRVCGTDCWEGEYFFELGFLAARPASGYTIHSVGISLRKCGPGRFVRKSPLLTLVPVSGLALESHSLVQKLESRFFVHLEQPPLPNLVYLQHGPPNPASMFVLRLHPSTVVKHVIPDTHWDSENRFFFPSNGFRAGVFAIFVKIQLPGVAVSHPVILALNQLDYSAHLFDGALVGPGFSDWFFLQNGASPTIPLWSAFRSRIDLNKQHAREYPPDTIFIEQSTKCFNVKADVNCPWHWGCTDRDLLAIWTQLGNPYDYGPVVISLLINELSPSRDEITKDF